MIRPPLAARRGARPLGLLGLLAVPLASCATDAAPAAETEGGDGTVVVTATDDACEASTTDLAAGVSTFAITNAGTRVTEVYLYEGERVVTEKEDIGPGTSYDLTVDLDEGTYELACKPGMVGEGIRQDLVVSAPTTT